MFERKPRTEKRCRGSRKLGVMYWQKTCPLSRKLFCFGYNHAVMHRPPPTGYSATCLVNYDGLIPQGEHQFTSRVIDRSATYATDCTAATPSSVCSGEMLNIFMLINGLLSNVLFMSVFKPWFMSLFWRACTFTNSFKGFNGWKIQTVTVFHSHVNKLTHAYRCTGSR